MGCGRRVWPERGLGGLLRRWKGVLLFLKSTRCHWWGGGLLFEEPFSVEVILGRNPRVTAAPGTSLEFLIQNIGLSSKRGKKRPGERRFWLVV